MRSFLGKFIEKPILILLAANILAGLLVFRNYGLSWDEPLFYQYADALGYAYSPREWFSGNFDLEKSYGPSGEDHKTRGPAYILLAREPVHLLESFGLDEASAWHLVNFLFFQLGVYFLYRLSRRWMKPASALAASALFSWQPLLWGHSFINPKDPPFLVCFLASVCLGFEMVNHLADESKTGTQKISAVILPGIFLGLATSIRVLGPLAGLLVIAYAIWSSRRKLKQVIPPLFIYGLVTTLAMLASWPFLWENPIARFIEVFRLMSDNPTQLSVLFDGEVFRANDMPRRYLPFMLAATLTEPVWLLFFIGSASGFWAAFKRRQDPDRRVSLILVLLWFLILLGYVLIRQPALYDGLRHFMFILPPVFILGGIGFEFLMERFGIFWLRAGLVFLLLLPEPIGILQLHPYEYAYYNSFVGGTGAVFREYETEYWLTCYKEAVERLDEMVSQPKDLYVRREAYIAEYYADEQTTVHELRGARREVESGDYVLVSTRTNEDRSTFRDAPTVLKISRGKALFCVIRQIP